MPDDLTTLHACRRCNRELGRDEEYVILAIAYASFNPRLQERLADPEDLGGALNRNPSLKARIEQSIVSNPDGVNYLRPEHERVERVFKKLVIGLYFRRYDIALLPREVTSVGIYHERQYPIRFHVAALTERFQLKRWDKIQAGVFEYVFVSHPNSKDALMVLVNIYDTIGLQAACPRPHAAKKSRYRSTGLPFRDRD